MSRLTVLSVVVAALLLAFVAGVGVRAQEGSGSGSPSETTITGEVVDLMGYVVDAGNRGEGYRETCRKCIEMGGPVGILSDQGDVYLVLGFKGMSRKIADLAKEAASTVQVSGVVHERAGIKGIMISSTTNAAKKAAPPEGSGRRREGSGR